MTHPTDNATAPSHEQIAIRAELLWKAKGNPQGQDDQIWLEAEQQLAQEIRENDGNSASGQPLPSSQKTFPESVVQEQMLKPRAGETQNVETPTPKSTSKNTPTRKKSSGR